MIVRRVFTAKPPSNLLGGVTKGKLLVSMRQERLLKPVVIFESSTASCCGIPDTVHPHRFTARVCAVMIRINIDALRLDQAACFVAAAVLFAAAVGCQPSRNVPMDVCSTRQQ